MSLSVTSFFYQVLPKYLLMLLFFLDCIYYAVTMVLFYVGLYPSDEPPSTPSWDEVFHAWDNNSSTAHDDLSSAAAAAQRPLSSIIERQLPAMEYGRLVRLGRVAGEEAATCAVCLSSLEEREEVRELGNCRHVFHKECIDGWLAVGRLTCPMCRSALLPLCNKRRRGRCPLIGVRWRWLRR